MLVLLLMILLVDYSTCFFQGTNASLFIMLLKIVNCHPNFEKLTNLPEQPSLLLSLSITAIGKRENQMI